MNDLPELSGPLGSRLRQAREAHGLTLQYVSERLKFSLRQLQALEAGQFSQFSHRTHVRGFVRAYARLLELPEAELLAMVDSEVPPDAPVPERPQLKGAVLQSPRSQRWPLLLTIILTLMLVSAGAGWFFYGWLQRTELTQPPPPENQLLLETDIALDPSASGALASGPETASAATASQTAASAATPARAPLRAANANTSVNTNTSASQAMTAASPGPASAASPASAANGRLQLLASGASWVEIYDGAGKMRYRAMTRAGEQVNIAGKGPFRITVGKAAAVRLLYAGTPVDLKPHTRGEVARLRLP